uniref:Bm14306 n=1 Tax=Brugia malayi TaxID=6279 RepID=A0A1I9G722_BRUMA|nr:Bm14306 [Brugia malayi]
MVPAILISYFICQVFRFYLSRFTGNLVLLLINNSSSANNSRFLRAIHGIAQVLQQVFSMIGIFRTTGTITR